MIDSDIVKRIMNSFHCMKDHINSMENEYSQLIEKRRSYYKEEKGNDFLSTQIK